MKVVTRMFNQVGLETFLQALSDLKSEKIFSLPDDLLSSEEFTIEIDSNMVIESREFDTKEEIVKYLYEEIVEKLLEKKMGGYEIFYNIELWSWLSYFYFDTICPQESDGSRKIKDDSLYVLTPSNWKKYYRHLLATPVKLYHELKDLAQIYLTGNPYTHGDLIEQLASRMEIAATQSIIEAATILYWDSENKGLKRGFSNRNKPGNVRRFAHAIIPQFSMTFDLNSMAGNEIVQFLPSEFDQWKS